MSFAKEVWTTLAAIDCSDRKWAGRGNIGKHGSAGGECCECRAVEASEPGGPTATPQMTRPATRARRGSGATPCCPARPPAHQISVGRWSHAMAQP